jgi:signal transduction histidine kinase/PAS domain-containing protein
MFIFCSHSNMVVIGRAITDRSKRIVDIEIVGCNEVYARHLDKSIKDVTGLYIIRDFFEGEEPEWLDVVRDSIITHESRHLEFVYDLLGTRYSGSVFCLSPIRKRCCFIMDEVSEEHNRKRELREAQDFIDSVLHLSGTSTWRWNLKTNKIIIIQAAFKLGDQYDRSEIAVDELLNRVHPEDRHLLDNFTKTYPENGNLKEAVFFRIRKTEGGWRWFQSVAVRTEYDEDGKPLNIDGVSLDVDSLKQSQLRVEEISRELEAKQKWLVYSFKQSHTGYCSWNVLTDKLCFSENFWQAVGGISPEAESNMVIPDSMRACGSYLIHDDPERFEQWLKSVQDGSLTEDDFIFRCRVTFIPDIWLEVRTSVIERDANGRLLWLSAFMIDITEMKKHEQALTLAIREADEASQAKNRFLAIMSHEIRTPLNAIIGFSSIIKKADISPQLKSYSESIRSSGEMLLILINDLLDLAKMESRKMHLNLQPVNVHHVLCELVDMFALKVEFKGLFLHIHCPETLPLLNLDAKRLKQVLINLVGNASKFTNIGGITINVNCELCEELDSSKERKKLYRLTISVKDTGEGISKQDFDSIFNPFEQAVGRRSEYVEGSGLGLSICKNLVGLMGGNIACTSEVGVGSDFVVTLENVEVAEGALEEMDEAKYAFETKEISASFDTAGVGDLQKKVFVEIVKQFGEQLAELQNGMHVQSARLLVADLQKWMVGYDAPQVQVLVDSLQKAVEDFDVTEVKRASKFLLMQGSDNDA